MPSGAGTTELRRERRRKIALDLIELHKTALALFSAFAKAAGVRVPDQSLLIQQSVNRWGGMIKAPALGDLFDLIESVEHIFRQSVVGALQPRGVKEGVFSMGRSVSATKAQNVRSKGRQRDSVWIPITKGEHMVNDENHHSTVTPTTPKSVEAHALRLVPSARGSDQAEGHPSQNQITNVTWLTHKDVGKILGVSKYLLGRMEKDELLVPVTVAKIGKREIKRYRKQDVEDYCRAMDLL
jgi:hypothetical protein